MYLLTIYMNYFVFLLVVLTYPSYFRQLSPVESPWEKKIYLYLDLTVLKVTVLMLCFLCCFWKQLFLTCSIASLFLAFLEKFILFYYILTFIVYLLVVSDSCYWFLHSNVPFFWMCCMCIKDSGFLVSCIFELYNDAVERNNDSLETSTVYILFHF